MPCLRFRVISSINAFWKLILGKQHYKTLKLLRYLNMDCFRSIRVFLILCFFFVLFLPGAMEILPGASISVPL